MNKKQLEFKSEMLSLAERLEISVKEFRQVIAFVYRQSAFFKDGVFKQEPLEIRLTEKGEKR